MESMGGFLESLSILTSIMKKSMKFLKLGILIITPLFTLMHCLNPSTQENSELRTNKKTTKLEISHLHSDSPKQFEISKEFLMGRFSYKLDTNFIKVPDSLSSKEIYIQKRVLMAFIDMNRDAKKSKINLKIISGTRNFSEQKGIWERKWILESKRLKDHISISKKILTYSSMPSTSRHHWGTDIDINSLESAFFKNGRGLKEYKWLQENAKKFGFHQVYSKKLSGRTGYNEEEWHWSYMPLSIKYLTAYNKFIKYSDIIGFTGSETSQKVRIIEDYVNGIAPWNDN